MEINLPGLVNTAVPNRNGRNIAVLSGSGPNYKDPGFLSGDFPRDPPKLYVTAESDDFDELTLAEWRDEGFNVEYFSMGNGAGEYRQKLEEISRKELGPCETYGIVAYGDAAAFCLEHFHIPEKNHELKLGCLIAYYPTSIPDPKAHYSSSIQVLVHLAGSDVGIVKNPQMVGIQGKRRTSRQKIQPGIGTGGMLKLAYPSYTYNAEPGFAEHDLDEYNKVSADLAWTRSLTIARNAFRRDVDLELILEKNIQSKFFTRDLQQTMSTYVSHKEPHVTHFPTLTGGVGADELQRFYADFFLHRNPPTMKLTLISRTIGVDRVVDEMHVAFKHSQETPWILPGLPPTNKKVEVIVVNIVTIKGGKLHHEHIYWDQASVLVQIGLLNPKLVPPKAKQRGVEQLPVVGREAAQRILTGIYADADGEAANELIPDWNDEEPETTGEDEDQGADDSR